METSLTPIRRVALLTAGGLAPCLSAAVADLIDEWSAADPTVEIIAYRDGYAGLLTGDAVTISPETRAATDRLRRIGGSPIGNSRVKLTNVEDCRKRNLVGPDEVPLEVAARRLADAGVDVLHTIGGDDTSTTAADLAAYLAEHDYGLTVVGLPKTIDNDVTPIRQSLGAVTAAEQSALFAQHVVAEHSANPRMLVVHEVMGRNCGWLTAAAGAAYHRWAAEFPVVPGLVEAGRWDVHAVYVPEQSLDIAAETDRLGELMDRHGGVNVFISEGAGVHDIVAEMERNGEKVPRDAFGHVKLDAVNPGAWLAKRLADKLKASKTLVAKSGYFARSSAANDEDLDLIRRSAAAAVASAQARVPGLVGLDEERGDELRAIELDRIKGGKPFDPGVAWFGQLQREIGQAPA
jgi:pyrophosphate--fructose-6-phosphate 1-phosphotransferase